MKHCLWAMRGTRSAEPRGLGGDFDLSPLKSPRNPITPSETSRDTLHPPLCRCGDISPKKGRGAENVPNDFALRGAFGDWSYGFTDKNVRARMARL